MEQWNWQLISVFICITGAGWYLFRNLIQFLSGASSGGCDDGGCHDCPSASLSSSTEESETFISLSSLTNSSRQK